jgi:hypothetical protein
VEVDIQVKKRSPKAGDREEERSSENKGTKKEERAKLLNNKESEGTLKEMEQRKEKA